MTNQDDIWPTPERMLQEKLDENRQMIQGQIEDQDNTQDWELIAGCAEQARQLNLAIYDLRAAAQARVVARERAKAREDAKHEYKQPAINPQEIRKLAIQLQNIGEKEQS